MKYKVIDLGRKFYPSNEFGSFIGILDWPRALTDKGDLSCDRPDAGQSKNPVVRMFDGSLIDVPFQLSAVADIKYTSNGDFFAIGRASGNDTDFYIWDIKNNLIDLIQAPEVGPFYASSINEIGDICGYTKGSNSKAVILNWYTKGVRVFSDFANLRFLKNNDIGAATGSSDQGPIYFDGSSVHLIPNMGPRVGNIINNHSTIVLQLDLKNFNIPNKYPPIVYNWATKISVVYNNTVFAGVNIAGSFLWKDFSQGGNFKLDNTEVVKLFPAGSAWSDVFEATDLNSRGDIAGVANFQGGRHGFILARIHVRAKKKKPVPREPSLVAMIIAGVINDGGGLEWVGGKVIHIPPRAPVSMILKRLPAGLRSQIKAAITSARLDTREGLEALRLKVIAAKAKFQTNAKSQV